jgi:hypothetical protein
MSSSTARSSTLLVVRSCTPGKRRSQPAAAISTISARVSPQRRAGTVLDALRVHVVPTEEPQRTVDVRRPDTPVESAVVDELVDERGERLEALSRVLAGVAGRIDLERRPPERAGGQHRRASARSHRQPLLEQLERRCGHAGEQPARLLEHRRDRRARRTAAGDAAPARSRGRRPRRRAAGRAPHPSRARTRPRVDGERRPLLELDATPADRVEQRGTASPSSSRSASPLRPTSPWPRPSGMAPSSSTTAASRSASDRPRASSASRDRSGRSSSRRRCRSGSPRWARARGRGRGDARRATRSAAHRPP